MVAVNGENTAERPMWTEKGGLDFEGRAKWDAWAAVKGMKPEKAKLEFVRVRAFNLCISLGKKELACMLSICMLVRIAPLRGLLYSQIMKFHAGRP